MVLYTKYLYLNVGGETSGSPETGKSFRFMSCVSVCTELVRSVSDGFGSRPASFSKQQSGGFQKMSRRMSNSSVVLSVAIDIGSTVQGFYGDESKNERSTVRGSMGMTEKACVFYRGLKASESLAWPSDTKSEQVRPS